MSPPNHLPAVPAPDHIGQATAVEQARAVAEVQAAVVVAQQRPRNIDTARSLLRASCELPAFADAAFYDYPRAGGRVTGPSADFAREVARCWGNFQSGTDELRRDTKNRYSEMKAWAWDLETNARRSITFVVPHDRDKDSTTVPLTSQRDIYENNQNMAARREREMILSTLPTWFVDEAITICRQTLARDEAPIEERRQRVADAFAKLGVSLDRIERKLGGAQDKWTSHDLSHLTTVYRSLNRGHVSIEEEFPPAAPTIAQLGTATSARRSTPAKRASSRARAVDAPAAGDEPAPEPPPEIAGSNGDGQLQYAPDDDGRPFIPGED